MATIKAFLRWFFMTICIGLALALIAEFFIEWGREHGYYTHPSQKLDAALNAFRGFVAHPWFLAGPTACLGLTVGLWVDWALRRLEELRRQRAIPSKERLYELHLRIEELRDTLLADAEGAEKVKYSTFHEVFAIMPRLLELGIPVPFTPRYRDIVQYESFTREMYRYFSAISPLLRDGNLTLAREWARSTLELMKDNIPSTDDAASSKASK